MLGPAIFSALVQGASIWRDGWRGLVNLVQFVGSAVLAAAFRGRAAHAVAFHKVVQDHLNLLTRQPHIGSERLLLRLREPLAALLALPALNPIPTIETCLHHLDPAVVARHFGLAFFGRKGQNDSGFDNPAFGFGPRLGPASS